MDNNNLKKWGSFVAFLILAGISCWATEHSFHLLIQWMPEPFVWGFTIAFFILASYGTKLMVDALDKDNWMEHRRRTFWIGTILVVVFWLLMSMPTNTHTFFYNHNIGNKVQDDITATVNYLTQLQNRDSTDAAYDKIHEDIHNIFKDMSREYNGIGGTGRKGNGEYVREKISEMNNILEKELPGSAIKFNDGAMYSTDPRVLSGYENQMNKALENIKTQKYQVSDSTIKEASEDIAHLRAMEDTIKIEIEKGSISEDVVTQTEGVLLSGYTCIKNNARFVRFNNQEDHDMYTADNLETKTKRMLSVIDVWGDFFKGKYPISFLFYILLSILVDVGAFMFFDFTFRKRDN